MQFGQLKRREFISLLGSAAAWPLATRAQQPPIIGFLNAASSERATDFVRAFRQGLSELGYHEGQNLAIEFRWAEGQYDRLPALAADLVRRHVAVIAATTTPGAVAAKAATSTIPIVFNSAADPVSLGLVASFASPGGNATGVAHITGELDEKRLALLHELVPNATNIGVLANPSSPYAESSVRDVQAAANLLGLEIHALNARNEGEIDKAFTIFARMKVGALLIVDDAFFTGRRVQFATLAARDAIPVMYPLREYAQVGGLVCYGTNLRDVYRQVGVYTGRVLKGEKPADLPVQRPIKFDLCYQSANREISRVYRATDTARPRRRGD